MGKLIGYTQGTYDMFHIGHLNLIKNAKRRCDYLIVGVNTDELVESYKHKRPIIPLAERAEIVRAIRYVDEVLITDTLDKKAIWDKIRFDEIYIGDDWKGNERWEKTGKEMEALGAKLVYLPDYRRGFLVNDIVLVLVHEVAIYRLAGNGLAAHAFCSLNCLDFFARISHQPFVEQISQRGKIVVHAAVCAVHIVVDSDKTHSLLGEQHFRVKSHLQVVSP